MSVSVKRVYDDGRPATTEYSNSIAPAAGSFDLTSAGPGTYGITVWSTDNDFDWSADLTTDHSCHSTGYRVTVHDDDTAAPTIEFTADDATPLVNNNHHSESHGDANAIGWEVEDEKDALGKIGSISRVDVTLFRNSELLTQFQAEEIVIFL